ncbi:Smr/MutS family protein [Thiomicrorhabdus sp. 6S2-11]|uniref:Smr/MutS family protein n=1 Tax=Thiomicrorhabdus marina TaxID=2818442 RepID=A0ABS3Q396_9GAMM|nr:Smr/MutS family protein [Thiomicrorhabdus marina]MBO1926613.1 Smr/MutS family protein [Thiomicrorhabdus marina]
MSEQDENLFTEAMQDVMPLKNTKKVNQYNRSKQQQASQQTLRKLKRKQVKPNKSLQLNRYQEFSKVTAFEQLDYAQQGVQTRELRQLKKGDFRVESVLDLHGYTQDQAQKLLNDFLAEAINYRARFLRIVHGKGYNSDSEYPVLKNLTNEVLRQCPQVIAFTSAAEKDGGVGAVNVLLKAS